MKIRKICNNCANKLKSPYNKECVGLWTDECDICKETTFVADAYHDYGIDEKGNIVTERAFMISNCF